jgi:hypothetical protein
MCGRSSASLWQRGSGACGLTASRGIRHSGPVSMPTIPEEFYAHAMQAADADGRLPLSRMTAGMCSRSSRRGCGLCHSPARYCPEPRPRWRDRRGLSCLHRRPGCRSGPMSIGGCRCSEPHAHNESLPCASGSWSCHARELTHWEVRRGNFGWKFDCLTDAKLNIWCSRRAWAHDLAHDTGHPGTRHWPLWLPGHPAHQAPGTSAQLKKTPTEFVASGGGSAMSG